MRLRPKSPATDIMSAQMLQVTQHDTFDVAHLLENIAIFGQPGSGKTSGSGAHLAKAALKLGCGMLVLCAKPDERALWERYCAQTARTGSLVVFDGKQHRYNFIAAELALHGINGLGTVVELIMHVMESARALSGTGSKGGDQFWEDIQKVLLRYTLLILFLATGTARIPDIIAFVRSAPNSREEAKSAEWQQRSLFFRCVTLAAGKMAPALAAQIMAFWLDEWAQLEPRTKSNASIGLLTTLDCFNHGWLREAFCTDTTIPIPEMLMQGAVVVLDMPALTHMEDGILGQRLIKFVSQRRLLARQSFGQEHVERPVGIWADEAPVFVDSQDAKYLALCRSTKSFMVLMAQSIPSYYAVMGGENARDRVDQLLANCATKIWHANSCPITNKIASDTIGQSLQRRANYSNGSGSSANGGSNMGLGENWGTNSSSGSSSGSSWSQQGGGSSNSGSNWSHGHNDGGNANRGRSTGWGTSSNVNEGWSEQMAPMMEPSAFGRVLRTGSAQNNYRVSAVIYQAGRVFLETGEPVTLVEFVQ